MAKITNVDCKLEVRANCKYYKNSAKLHIEVLKTTVCGIGLQFISLLLLAAAKNSLSFRELMVYGISFFLVANSYPSFNQLERLFARILKGYSLVIVAFAFLGLLRIIGIFQNGDVTMIGLSIFSLRWFGISLWTLWCVLLGEVVLGLVFYFVSWAAFSFSPETRIQKA